MPTSENPLPYAGKQTASNTTLPIVPIDESLSPEDKMVFYAVLQDIANELRRINREQKKHQA